MYKWGGDGAEAMMVTSQNHRQSSIMTVSLPSAFHIRLYQIRNKLPLSATQSLKAPNARQFAISMRGPRYVALHTITGDSGAA
jgi:hypothetical protein